MKTDPPPVRNPDPQLASADINTSPLDADTNNWGPRLGVAWSPPSGGLAVRGGWGLFYGRTPSIMLGTAHSNNGINIVSLTFTGDAVPTYPNNFSQIHGRHRGAAEHLLHRSGLRELATDAGEPGRRMGGSSQYEPHRDLPLRRRRAICRGRSIATSALPRRARSRWPDPATRSPIHFFGPDRSFANFPARDRVRVDRRVPLQRPDPRVESPLGESPAVPRRLHARQGRRHRARRDGGRPRQRRRRCKVRVQPSELRGRSHRRQQRPASSSGGERHLRHNGFGRQGVVGRS